MCSGDPTSLFSFFTCPNGELLRQCGAVNVTRRPGSATAHCGTPAVAGQGRPSIALTSAFTNARSSQGAPVVKYLILCSLFCLRAFEILRIFANISRKEQRYGGKRMVVHRRRMNATFVPKGLLK